MTFGRSAPVVARSAALALALAFAGAVLPAPAQPLAVEGYAFPIEGRQAIRDWNGDGVADVAFLGETRLRVWLARPGQQGRFGLRPDFEAATPDGALLRFALFDEAEPNAPALVALDAEGLLAWTASAGWGRVWTGENSLAGATRDAAARGWSEAEDVDPLPDLDGDGYRDFPVCGAGGQWRVVWGPLRPGVEAPETVVGAVAEARRFGRIESEGRPPSILQGARWGFNGARAGLFRTGRQGERLALNVWTQLHLATPDGELPSNLSEPFGWEPSETPGLFDIQSRRRRWRQTATRAFEEVPPPADPAEEKLALDLIPAPLFEPTYDDKLREVATKLTSLLAQGDEAQSRVADIDGDGVRDLLYVFGSSEPLRPRSNIRVYLGRADGSVPDYRKPDSTLRANAILNWPLLVDADGDGDMETALFFPEVNYASPSDQLKAYMQLGLPGEFRLYLWEKGKGYAEARSFGLKLSLKHEVFGLRMPTLADIDLRGDFNGDGFVDLGFETGAREYSIWTFDPKRGFSAKPAAVAQTPDTILDSSARDVDGDGRMDLLLSTHNADRPGETFLRLYFLRDAR
jgi:hypothetical protein